MNIEKYGDAKRGWLVGIHMVFVLSTLLLSLSDRMSGEGKNGGH